MLKFIAFTILLLLKICIPVLGQQVSVFQSITTKDGLPSNYIFDISQDENGFLWIGTDKGLAKYDGFRWQVFNMENGLPGNYIKTVLCNGKNGIWLGIASKGIYYYQISTGKITFSADNPSDYEYQLNKDGDLFFYIIKTNDIKTGNYVKASEPDKVQQIFSYNNAFADYSISVDFEKQHLEYIKNSTVKKSNLPFFENYLHWKTDTLNFTVNNSDLIRKKTDNFYYNNNSIYLVKPGSPMVQKQVYSEHNFYLYTLQHGTEYYCWNEVNGLQVLNRDGNKIKQYSEKDGLPNPMVTDVFLTKNGNFLIGTLGGGMLYKLPNGSAKININDKPVRGLAQNTNKIFAIADNKLLQFNSTNPDNLSSFPLPDKSIQGLNLWGEDIFISSLFGFSVYQVKGKQLIKKEEQKIGAGISAVIQYEHNFYAGSYGNHILQYDHKNHTVTENFKSFPVIEKLQTLKNGYVGYNYEDGLQIMQPNKTITLTVKDGLPANAVYHVHEYRDTIWISTAKGVAAYTNGKVIKTYTVSDGIKGNHCVFSFHDNKGSYWVLTDRYLHEKVGQKFNPLTSLSVTDGKDDAAVSCLYNPNTNSLVIGSSKKIFLIQLDHIQRNETATLPQIAAVFADGLKVTDSFAFHLPSNYQNLSFSFQPVDANPFVKSFIYYKLEGMDDQYRELKDSLQISFSKLRSGRYRLFAKTINANGIESDVILLSEFKVDAPYWQKAWFFVLCSIGAAMALFAVYYSLQKRKEKKIREARLLEESLATERERISKDLHDHLGTSLVTMIAQTDNIEARLLSHQPEEALEKVKQLSDQSRETVNVLRETIWAVQENSHTIEEFELRVRSFLQRVLAPKNIAWELNRNGSTEKKLSANQSLQLFRVMQEATQNIIKHANASQVQCSFHVLQKELEILLQDDGKGFELQNNHQGNGIKNMQQRMEQIGGSFSMKNKNGTTIGLKIKL